MLLLIVTSDEATLRWVDRLSKAMDQSMDSICGDAASALVALSRHRFDVVIVDQNLQPGDALSFVRKLRQDRIYGHVPVVSVVGAWNAPFRQKALGAGVVGIVSRRDDPRQVATWLRTLVSLLPASTKKTDPTDAQLTSTSVIEQLHAREREMMLRLTRAVEYRDNDTGEHTMRVARYSEMLAEELGLSAAFCRNIRLAAPLHDIGKVAIPDDILLKQGRLTEDEMEVVRSHALVGERILDNSTCGIVRLAAEIAGHHHERWDGSGYPRRLTGTDIPLSARIVAVADVFDAMTTERPYKAALPIRDALDHIETEAGGHFDPNCARAFVKTYEARHTFLHAHSQNTPPVGDGRGRTKTGGDRLSPPGRVGPLRRSPPGPWSDTATRANVSSR